MDNKLISIIVPVYNVCNYLEKCVNSLLIQTYKNLEIILVDDGSTDSSGEMCDKFASTDTRIRVIHKANGGLSDARNIGIIYASGDYIGFVDSDDWVEQNMYEELYKSCIKNDADISVCGYYRDYVDKSIVGNKYHIGVYEKEKAIALLLEGVVIQDHAVTKLYKKDLWKDIKFPERKIYEDIRTIYKVFFKANKIAVNNIPLYHYRQRLGSIVRNGFSENKFEWANAVNELYDNKEISNNSKLIDILNVRMLRVKCCILRELFIYGNKESWMKYKSIEKEYIKLIKKYRRLILEDKSFSKVFKLMAVLSLTNEKVCEYVFSTRFVKKYLETQYKYYK